eukprot:4520730-Amphidinium_carterae.3
MSYLSKCQEVSNLTFVAQRQGEVDGLRLNALAPMPEAREIRASSTARPLSTQLCPNPTAPITLPPRPPVLASPAANYGGNWEQIIVTPPTVPPPPPPIPFLSFPCPLPLA